MKATPLILAITLLCFLCKASASNFGPGTSYLWMGNLGWAQLVPDRPNPGNGVDVTDTYLSGYGWSDSTGWINFGDGSPINLIRYSNTSGNDSGVNHDGEGNLTGLAWSANLGWINFGWWTGDPTNPDRPRFNLKSGKFTGYAWSANAGWVNLGTSKMKIDSLLMIDTDADGISDAWEYTYVAKLTTLTQTGDFDADTWGDVEEYLADTDPLDPNDNLRIIQIVPAPDTLSTTLTWLSRPTRIYQIAQSPDLVSPFQLSYFIAPDSGSQTTETEPHPASSKRFFKVISSRPVQP